MAKAGLHLTVQCAYCSTPFRQPRHDQKYCGRKCYAITRRQASRHDPIVRDKICEQCGNSYHAGKSTQKFCSKKCCANDREVKRRAKGGPGKQWSKGNVYVARTACQMCGKLFYAPPVQKRRGGGKFCSLRCSHKNMAMNPRNYPQTKTRRGNGGMRDDLGLYVRSSWEANYARYLNFLMQRGEVLEWSYEPCTFEFEGIQRGCRFYTPDFLIKWKDGKEEYHELKGYMDAKSATKLKRMKKYHPKVPLVLIDKHAYRKLADLFSRIIPNWEVARIRKD